MDSKNNKENDSRIVQDLVDGSSNIDASREETLNIQIPKVEYKGEDQQLLQRVHKFKSGSLRILIFTLVGMILGWFSIGYYTDSFIVTKVLLAIPYKISEAIYVTIIGTDFNVFTGISERMTEFFPQSMIATFLAERITPVLIGGAFYGCLAYFTGDKKVFTMKRFVKFVAVWAMVILTFLGVTYGVNAKAKKDNSNCKNITGFYLMGERRHEGIFDEPFEVMKEAFLAEKQEYDGKNCDFEQTHPFLIVYGPKTRNMVCFANFEQGYIWTENHDVFLVSDQFLNYIKKYEETSKIDGITNMDGKENEDE